MAHCQSEKTMTPKQTGALLRKAREKRGWTWNRTATESGLKADQIKGIEQANRAYTNDSLLVLAKVFGYEQHFLSAKGSEAAFTKGATGSKDVRG
jgi:transcriptional regulator with XRE-family HTH domain